MKEIKLFINGEFRTSANDFISTNPANGEAVAKVYLPSEKDIDDAVDAAEAATRVNTLQTLLETAYSVTAKIQNLSLVNYL